MSLKDALLKAGYSSTKIQNERPQKAQKLKPKIEKHQEHRNFCEVCESVQPDVERFKHKKVLLDAQWICVNCADKNEIHDECRLTQQSEFSRSHRYRRYYGPTRDLEREKKQALSQNQGVQSTPPHSSTSRQNPHSPNKGNAGKTHNNSGHTGNPHHSGHTGNRHRSTDPSSHSKNSSNQTGQNRQHDRQHGQKDHLKK